MRSNPWRLFVTAIIRALRACAAISMSCAPIGLPAASNAALTLTVVKCRRGREWQHIEPSCELFHCLAVVILNLYRRRTCSFRGVIPEIDIWRAAQLMLKR